MTEPSLTAQGCDVRGRWKAHARVSTCNAMRRGSKPQVLHSARNGAHLLPLWHHLLWQGLPPHADHDHVGNLQTGSPSIHAARAPSVLMYSQKVLALHHCVQNLINSHAELRPADAPDAAEPFPSDTWPVCCTISDRSCVHRHPASAQPYVGLAHRHKCTAQQHNR